MRWFTVAFALLQFSLYQPPPGMTLPFDRTVAALVVSGTLVLLNVCSAVVHRRQSLRRWFPAIAVAELVADAVLTFVVVALFTFDANSALWALFVLPVLEGALRGALVGAVVTWAALVVGYVLLQVDAAARYAGVPLRLDSLTYRSGILLIVAVTVGYLARNVVQQVRASADARQQSDHRAELLHTVATASRSMASPDPELVFSVVVDAAIAIGFDAAEICVFDTGNRCYRVRHAVGLPVEYTRQVRSSDEGLVGRVIREGGTAVTDDYTKDAGGVAEVRAVGFRAGVGTPIWSGGRLAAVLAAGRLDARPVTATEVECLQLLAAQAGAALLHAKRLTERAAYEAQLAHQATHDPLTALPNRALFLDRLERALARRRGDAAQVAVLFVDLDRFKNVNDTLGHAVGDGLLVSVAERLLACVRGTDTVARLGGDEFTILLEDEHAPAAAARVAEMILASLGRPLDVEGLSLVVSASVGIATAGAPTAGPAELLREADVAMYSAKERGRGRFEVYHVDLDARTMHRYGMERSLRRAIERDEVRLEYQPIFSLEERRMVGLEALARWDEDGGRVPPSQFIAVAEETGLILPLGRRILERACEQARRWQVEHQRALTMSVNVSPIQLEAPGFVDDVRDVLVATGLGPASLILEITESAAVAGDGDVLERLRDLGVRLALDDFGKGHSSLTRLRRLPVHILKVDKAFVDGIATSSEDRAIVRSVVTLGRELGVSVTAEGIETAAQLEAVHRLGCDRAQGFFLAEPFDADAVALLLQVELAARRLPHRPAAPVRRSARGEAEVL